ncbi:hypothetical protein B0H12DRAFT_1113720 [Mycena haematopus]|nr:hypothetical protein B0H12DRAFT_1113720 [Mycena haematopus]
MEPPPTPPSVSGPNPIAFDSNWPKRTQKACSNCRRDKTRCDGARPCSGCSKKSLQCLDGCDPCRRARARCERTSNEHSCRRCDLKELICTEQTPTVTAQIASASSPSPASVPSDRAKTACQNCRNDNKKCDNQRPCSRCVARYETCIPLSRGSKIGTRCEGCKKRNVRCEGTRPCQSCVTAGTECVNVVARKGPSTSTRAKALQACVNCRRNKSRCNGERPCAGCSRRGLDCQEQVCKRCAEGGVDECTHRARLSEVSPPYEAIPSTSNAGSQSSAGAMPVQLSEPSMFAPITVPFYSPASPADPTRA